MSHDEEHAHAPATKEQKVIGLVISIIAIVLAIISMVAGKSKSEEMLTRIALNDSWSFYQAKRVRRALVETASDQLSLTRTALAAEQQASIDKTLKRYADEIARYKTEGTEIEEKAKHTEEELKVIGRRIQFFEIAETIIHVSIVLCSVAILTSQQWFFRGGVLMALAGIVTAAYSYLVIRG